MDECDCLNESNYRIQVSMLPYLSLFFFDSLIFKSYFMILIDNQNILLCTGWYQVSLGNLPGIASFLSHCIKLNVLRIWYSSYHLFNILYSYCYQRIFLMTSIQTIIIEGFCFYGSSTNQKGCFKPDWLIFTYLWKLNCDISIFVIRHFFKK